MFIKGVSRCMSLQVPLPYSICVHLGSLSHSLLHWPSVGAVVDWMMGESAGAVEVLVAHMRIRERAGTVSLAVVCDWHCSIVSGAVPLLSS